MKHITVLQTEAVDALGLKSDSVVVDATYGGGGHAKEICHRLGSKGVYVGIDADQTAFTKNPLDVTAYKPKIHLVKNNFSKLNEILSSLHIKKVDAILADLGWRTDQFSDGGKGFSFQSDDPLYMTFGEPKDYIFTADDLVNTWKEEDIANVLYGYGDERSSRRIAKSIVENREKAPIKTAKELAEIISEALPGSAKRKSSINPATKSFQAIRIAVNDELKVLEEFIDQAVASLAEDGRLAIISFHSIEDRIVKFKFKELVKVADFELITKKPQVSTSEELANNPRARSAKLRIIKKLSNETHEY